MGRQWVGAVYYEKIAALRVDYRCNIPTNWEVRISAGDFRDGNKTVPISRLQWRLEEGNSSYQPMPSSGGYVVLARRRDHLPLAGVEHSKTISYRLELREMNLKEPIRHHYLPYLCLGGGPGWLEAGMAPMPPVGGLLGWGGNHWGGAN